MLPDYIEVIAVGRFELPIFTELILLKLLANALLALIKLTLLISC